MNCDQVFDVLTRGPFPTGTACDEPVEAHLSACPDCRRLAEALRPAVELFQEAVDPEESRDLPGYWSTPASDRQAVLSYAPEVESHRTAHLAPGDAAALRGGNWSALTAWRMVAMLAVGVTLGLLLSARSSLDRFDFSPFGSGAKRAPLAAPPKVARPGVNARLQLASLPPACLSGADEIAEHPLRDRLDPALARYECCSECHNASSQGVPAAATVQVAQSCQLCHNEQRMWRFEAR